MLLLLVLPVAFAAPTAFITAPGFGDVPDPPLTVGSVQDRHIASASGHWSSKRRDALLHFHRCTEEPRA